MPENRPAHTARDLTPGMSGYIMPSAIKVDAEGRYWLDPNAPVIVHRVMIQAFGPPPAAIKLTHADDGYRFACLHEGIEFETADESERSRWISLTLVD